MGRAALLHPGRVPGGGRGAGSAGAAVRFVEARGGWSTRPGPRPYNRGDAGAEWSAAASSGANRSSRGSTRPWRRPRAGVATTVLVAGSAGMGASRFLDEVLERAAARPEPPLVLRGRAHGPVDPPWASVLEALGPLLATRPPTSCGRCSGATRGRSSAGCPRLADLAAGDARSRGRARSPTRSAASRGRSRPSCAGSAAVAAERPIVLALEDLHVADAATRAFATFVAADRPRGADRRSCSRYQPDRLTREHPLRENLAVIEAGLRPPVRGRPGAVRPPRDRGADRGDRGRAAVGVDRGPRRRAVRRVRRWSSRSSSRPGASCGARRLTGTLADLIAARLARRSPECRRAAAAARPRRSGRSSATQLAVAAAAFEAELAIANVGSRPAPRRLPRRGDRTASTPTSPRGWPRRMEHGFVRRGPRRAPRGSATSSSPAPWSPTCCPRSGRATAPRLRRRLRRHPDRRRRTTGGRAHRLDEARGRGARGGPAGDRARGAARTRSPSSSSAWTCPIPPPEPAAEGQPPSGRPTASDWPRSRSWPPRRPPRPDAPTPRRRLRRERASRRSASGGTGSSTRSSRRGSGATGWRRATRRARPRPSAGPRTSCPRSRPRAGPDPRAARAGADDRAARSGTRRGSPGRRSTWPAAVGDEAEPEAIHALTTLAVATGYGRRSPRRPCRCSARRSTGPRAAGLIDECDARRAPTCTSCSSSSAGPPRPSTRPTRASPRRARRTSARCTATCSAATSRGSWSRSAAGPRRRELLPPGARLEPAGDRRPSTRSSTSSPSRSSRRRARRRRGCWAGCSSSSRPAATSSSRSPPTRRPRRTRCGAATSPTPGGPRSEAGRGCAGSEDWVLVARMAATVDGGRVVDRRRGAGEAADRRRGRVPGAGQPDPRRGGGRGRPSPRRGPGGPQRRAGGEPRDGPRVPRPPRRPRRPCALG